MGTSTTEPFLFVILGGTGDLAARKLLPAVCRLRNQGQLSDKYSILAVARNTEMQDESYREWVKQQLAERGLEDDTLSEWCDDCIHYQPVGKEQDEYKKVADRIAQIEKDKGLPGNRIFYLALPPFVFPSVIEALGKFGLNKSAGWTRLVIEKPFGTDLESAISLNAIVHEWFDERQVYRIDHYLGKETVQNLLVFRFANAMFETLFHRHHVENVQITVAEDLGVGGRAGYYDKSGALRDMIQNHITQLLALTAMEVPVAYEDDAVRAEKIKVLRAVRTINNEDVVFGQYEAGTVNGEHVPGYDDESGVIDPSRTETYAAVKLEVDNWRWKGVPFYLRTGKRLPRKVTEIVLTFRKPPVRLFKSLKAPALGNDALFITLQPEEGFSLYFDVKRPGEPFDMESRPLTFRYEKAFGKPPDAYVTLLNDVVRGDQTLFVHAAETEASWRIYTPVLESNPPARPYRAGSWGPREAVDLVRRSEHYWQTV